MKDHIQNPKEVETIINGGVVECKYLENNMQINLEKNSIAYPQRTKTSSRRVEMPMAHYDGYNFWVLKAINLNRGRGIHVFSDLDSLKKLVKHYSLEGGSATVGINSKYYYVHLVENTTNLKPSYEAIYSQPQTLHDERTSSKNRFKDNRSKNNQNNHTSFIIQKYIERPFLIHGRKFDIRVWVLVSSSGKCYFFKQGYLRTSASEFSMDAANPDCPEVHLTNNAVQKQVAGYGQYEDGNQLSYAQFQQYLDSIPGNQHNFYAE